MAFGVAVVAAGAALSVAVGSAPASFPGGSALGSDNEVAALFDGPLPGVTAIGAAPSITGDAAADDRIRELAQARGYHRRPTPLDPLGSVQGHRLQQRAIDDLADLQVAMAADVGARLTVTSGHRSVSSQRSIFLRRFRSNMLARYGRFLGDAEIALGLADAALDATLALSSPPGYSKHHTGYAIDVRSGGFAGFGFRSSAAYQWLVGDDYANAMRFGWIPSYPDDASAQGPNPEPWEWVWIGRDAAACARAGTCAVGGLDLVELGDPGRVVGWAASVDGDPVENWKLLTPSASFTVRQATVGSGYGLRTDVAAAYGLAGSVGLDISVPLTEPLEWICLEARSTGGSWARVGCLDRS